MFKEKIPQTEIAFLNRCGHATWVDQPEEYLKVVDTFLSKEGVKRENIVGVLTFCCCEFGKRH